MPIQITTTSGDAVRAAQTQAGANPLENLTVTQALAWIDANVTDLASARTGMKHIVKYLFIQKRRIDRLEAALQRYQQNRGK